MRKTSFDVLIPEVASTKRIFFDKIADKLVPYPSGELFWAYRNPNNGNQLSIE